MLRLFKTRTNYVLPEIEFVKRVTTPTLYPSGVAVETPEGVYYIKGRTKFKVYSDRVLSSWTFDLLPGTKESLSRLKYGGVLGFRSGTLIEDMSTGKFYLISDNKRRHIVSPDVFAKYGFDINNVIVVSDKEVNLHEEGEEIS